MEQLLDATEPTGSALTSNGFAWRQVPFTREGWDSEFPENVVTTSLGEVIPVSPEMVDQHSLDGESLIGLIRPTLEQPSFITTDLALRFHRPVLDAEGDVRGLVVVTLAIDFISVTVVDVIQHTVILNRVPSAEIELNADESSDDIALFKCLSASLPDGISVHVTDYSLASALMGWQVEFFKSEHGPIPDGARWITVHPNGEGTKGVPLLVQPAKDNSGTFHVIGGAGGKLNYLKLRGVKSEGEYQNDAKEKAEQRKAEKKQQTAEDKASGIHDAKTSARAEITAQRDKARDEFVSAVADAMGWGEDETKFKSDGLTPAAVIKGEADHDKPSGFVT